MLDMGEPVRIVDLARDMIRLSGLEEGADIQIAFTGIRPGEKLNEEMFFSDESAEATAHTKVLRARNGKPTPVEMGAIEELIAAAKAGADDLLVRRLLTRVVPEFSAVDTAVALVVEKEPAPRRTPEIHLPLITPSAFPVQSAQREARG